MIKVLITGGSGFVANNLINHLSQSSEYDVKYLSRICNKDPRCISVDFTQRESLFETLEAEQFEFIIHCAAYIPTPEDNADTQKCQVINFNGTYNMLEYARVSKTRGFLYLSSLSIFNGVNANVIDEGTPPQPMSDYARSKYSAEALCELFREEFKVRTSILRIGTVYGRGMNNDRMIQYFINKIRNSEGFEVYNSGSHLYTVYINDLVKIIETLIDRGNKAIINIASPGITKKQIVQNILKEFNSSIPITFDSGPSEKMKSFKMDNLTDSIQGTKLKLKNFREGLADYLQEG